MFTTHSGSFLLHKQWIAKTEIDCFQWVYVACNLFRFFTNCLQWLERVLALTWSFLVNSPALLQGCASTIVFKLLLWTVGAYTLLCRLLFCERNFENQCFTVLPLTLVYLNVALVLQVASAALCPSFHSLMKSTWKLQWFGFSEKKNYPNLSYCKI